MILSPQNILVLLFGATCICSQANDTCPDLKLTEVGESGESDKMAILRGYPGIPGYPGLQGPPGLQGQKGDEGVPGKAGDKGLTGEKGDKGDAGQMGRIGDKGDLGPPGRIGDRGPPGDKGNKGSQGTKGNKGPTGDKGVLGSQGITGVRGPTGQKGDQGVLGKTGGRGPIGKIGLQGEKGYSFRAMFGGQSGPTKQKAAKNCEELRDQGVVFSGWYTIHPDGMQPLQVLCDMVTDGGGWIVFQRRVDGSEDFHQDWETYKRGFGSQLTEFWLGNENIHRLTSGGDFQLRVDLEDFDNKRAYATYSNFRIGEEGNFYSLYFDNFIDGTAGDSLAEHEYYPFHTKDKDPFHESCADHYRGGWWFSSWGSIDSSIDGCYQSHLNGEYLRGEQSKQRGVNWPKFRGSKYSLKFSEMKFRPAKT